MVNSPRLTIGLPIYNGEAFVDQCIQSIVNQTYQDFELIVCDNASTDRTPELVEAWCSRDGRLQLHRASVNRGAAPNFNWCFELGRGELFKWCAVDDLMEPECVATCVAGLDASPEAVLAYPGAVDIDEAGASLGEIYDNREHYEFASSDVSLRFRDLICQGHSCISVFGVVRRSALQRSSLIGSYPASDKVLLAELGLQGPFVRVPGDLILHRQHKKRSVTEHGTLRERMAWFNTAHRGPVFPHFRLLREYSRAALVSTLPLAERARCLPQIGRWLSWEGMEGLADDLRFYLRRVTRASANETA
jgi:glycosyltransferase involved in cell wall biosynthesis